MSTVLNSILSFLSYRPLEPLSFVSAEFFILFLLVLIICRLLSRHPKSRLMFLVFFSVYFCYKAGGLSVLVLAGAALFNYLAGLTMARISLPIKRRFVLFFGLLINFGTLAFFKYSGFFFDNANTTFSLNLTVERTFLPVGISFYLFQAAGYLIDVYRRDAEAVRSVSQFGLFIAFFPKLLAGPIVRAKELMPQILAPTLPEHADTAHGFALIVSGLIKKMIIADFIGINFVDRIFDNPAGFSGIENLMASYGYTFQIYCDFSGYTDLALGLALLLGFRLPANFNAPYQAANIADFWRRWHISLSSWFRNYVYIPLGGNRQGAIRQSINLLVTMVICGLWHGPSWTFVFWGFLHGVGLLTYRLYKSAFPSRHSRLGRLFSLLITFHFVVFCWIFFRADSFGNAYAVITQITGFMNISLTGAFIQSYPVVFSLIVFACILHFLPGKCDVWWKTVFMKMNPAVMSLVVAATIWLVVQMRSTEIQPFIYLQF
jgi:alginate O-acetyltransferase complex protein AlgI